MQLDRFHQALISKMAQLGIACVARFIAAALEISFGNDAKRSNGRDCAAFVAIALVPVLAIHQTSRLESASRLNAVEEHVSRIEVAVAPVSIAVTIAEIAWVIGIAIKAGGSIQFNPPRLDVAGVTVTVAVAWVEVKTHCTPRWLHMAKAWRR